MGSNFPPSIASSIPSWNVTHLGLSASLLAIFQCCKRKKEHLQDESAEAISSVMEKYIHLQMWNSLVIWKCENISHLWNVTHFGLSASLLAIFQCCKNRKEGGGTYLGPKLCGNSTFALDRAISEP
jgi:hypothetical protein